MGAEPRRSAESGRTQTDAPDGFSLHALIEHLPAALMVKDATGRIIMANHKAALRVGLESSQDLLGKRERDFHPPAEAARRIAADQEVLASGRTVCAEEEPASSCSTGEVHRVQTTRAPLLNAAGARVATIELACELLPSPAASGWPAGPSAGGEHGSTGRAENLAEVNAALQAEIAQRRSLQSKLENERTLLRTMIDMIPALIYAKDAQSRFLECNTMVARGMGTTPEALIGKSDFDFYPVEMAQAYFADEQAIVKSGEPLIDREEPVLDKVTGVVRTYLTSKVPFRNSAGQVIGFAGLGRDITQLKEAERRLASTERLESIGRLAAGVAHEINTPVQFVSDSIYFINEGVGELLAYIDKLHAALGVHAPSDPNVLELQQELPTAIHRAEDGLARIAEIVRSLKEFSHSDESATGPIDLNHAIQSTLVVARNEYKYVAELRTEFADLPPITCHGGQINQVVLNLVVNAAHAIADVVKGTPNKGFITLKTELDEGAVVISVSDTGGGIPEAIRHRIFEPFFTTKEVGRGTGQGLSICRDVIVKGHGGAITFKTELGKGTTFYVRLPIEGKQSSAEERPA
jgi:two-component system NtrC family sensor kinase